MTTPTCSALSAAVREPLVGTAVESVDRWILLEVADAWAPKILRTEGLSATIRSKLTAWSEAPRSRLQLLRRPGRTGKRPTFFVFDRSKGMARLELDRHEDLLDLELDALSFDAPRPLALVCVHGRRDRCCAQHGGALYRALLRTEVESWQTSHLGGHRFAACALSLPDGWMYGRLRAEHAPDLARATITSEIADLDLLRGRCSFDRATQAADIFLRRRLEERRADALEWVDTSQEDERRWQARFQSASGVETIEVRLEELADHRPASCGAEPEPVSRFVEA